MSAKSKHLSGETNEDLETQWSALLQQQDALREEIKRGNDYLHQAEKDLAERKARLENWTSYEQQCGADCLGHLTHLVSTKERVTRFLNGWVERRSVELAGVERAIGLLTRRHGFAAFPNASVPSFVQPPKRWPLPLRSATKIRPTGQAGLQRALTGSNCVAAA